MNDTMTKRADLTASAVQDNPTVPSRQLARMVMDGASGHLFQSYNACYAAIRRARGAHGSYDRRKCRVVGNTPPPMSFPRSHCKRWPVYRLTHAKTLVLSDTHFPFHDKSAIQCAVAEGKRRDATCVLLNGDICDFFSASRFDKNPTKSSIQKEVLATRQFLRWLRAELPKANVIYKLGNHDEWFEKYLWRKSPELYGMTALKFDHIMTGAFGDRDGAIDGVEFVYDQRKIMAGKLNILHGHEYGNGSIAPAVNPARGAFLRVLECALVGHHHRASSHDETSANGKLISCWSTGCLCGLWPDYAKINKWNHSAAWVELDGDDFSVEPLRILRGELL